MANLVKFDMKKVPATLSEMYVRIEDLDRNVLYSGTVPAADEINIGTVGSVGQGVLIHGDNYAPGNESSFMSFDGYGVVEISSASSNGYDITLALGQSLMIGTQNGNYNSIPNQPEITNGNVFMLAGVGNTGVQNNVLEVSSITGIVPFSESNNIESQAAYYTPGTGFFSGEESATGQKKLWLAAGIGGTKLEDLSSAGTKNAYANEVKQLEYLNSQGVEGNINTVLIYHGGANYEDTKAGYYQKLVDYIDEQKQLIGDYRPGSNPKVILWQHGGEDVVLGVMQAQLQAHRNGVAVCAGATYWLNRKHPNIHLSDIELEGSGSPERIHLKTKGYQYAGEMALYAKADDFAPLTVESYEWVSETELKLFCNTSLSGGLEIGVDGDDIPLFDGWGFELLKPNGERLPASSLSIVNNELFLTFSEAVTASDKLSFGTTPRDLAYYGQYTPSQQGDSYVGNHLVGTNIRTKSSRQSVYGNEDFYDWLCVDQIVLVKNISTPASQVLGSNIWFGKTRGYTGLGETFNFDSSEGTITITDGDEVSTTAMSRSFGASATKEIIGWPIIAGKTYQVDLDVAGMTEAGRLQFIVGGTYLTINQSDLVNGHYTGQAVAQESHTYGLRLRENTGYLITDFDGFVSNIQLREVL